MYQKKQKKKSSKCINQLQKKTDIKNVINILKINNPLFSFIESIKIKMMKNKFSDFDVFLIFI